MKEMTQLQRYFLTKATEKARLRQVTVNGYPATVSFGEYEAPDELKEEFKKQDGSDGHYYYITFYIWTGRVKSYYTGKTISVDYTYITTKAEGNEIYKQLKATKTFRNEMIDIR